MAKQSGIVCQTFETWFQTIFERLPLSKTLFEKQNSLSNVFENADTSKKRLTSNVLRRCRKVKNLVLQANFKCLITINNVWNVLPRHKILLDKKNSLSNENIETNKK